MFVVHADADLLLTWDEFLGLPYETRNTDLIDGKMIVNSPNAQHERIVGNLLVALKLWQRALPDRLGEPTTQQPVKVTDRHGYQPDMSWFPVEQCESAGQRAGFSGLPAIVVEVLSPSTRRIDLVRKRGDYEALCIPEFWIIDPETEVMLIARRPAPTGGYTDHVLEMLDTITSPLLPGFRLPLSELFVA
jgi:Uma2 family endonuclease